MRIAYISTYLPRSCGIATFNNNVVKAILANQPVNGQTRQESSFGVGRNDSDELDEYEYSDEVKFVIRQDHQKDCTRNCESRGTNGLLS